MATIRGTAQVWGECELLIHLCTGSNFADLKAIMYENTIACPSKLGPQKDGAGRETVRERREGKRERERRDRGRNLSAF